MSPEEILAVFGPADGIPFFIDERVPFVAYVGPPPRDPRAWGLGHVDYPRGYLVGSMAAWGAFFAHNLAAAYRPEGLPWHV